MDNDPVLSKLYLALDALHNAKPKERSEEARRYAVAITEMEKVLAYYIAFISIDGAGRGAFALEAHE